MLKKLAHNPVFILGFMAVMFITVFLGSFLAGRYTVPLSFAEDFLVVTSVDIENTPYGMDPQMFVNREVVQNFSGQWVATIRPVETLEYACGNAGSAPYRIDAQLPQPLHLFDFWLFDKGDPASLCREGFYPLPRGCYLVDTTWDFVDPFALTTLSVHKRSSEFCVE